MKQLINRKDKKMRKRIMAINANDFGGKTGHLMSHRYFNNRDRRYHTDWKYWQSRWTKQRHGSG